MRQIVSLLLLIAFALQTFSKSIVVADYYTNTAKFAKLCINKSKPSLKCNGKCQMAKKIKEEDQKEQNTDTVKKGIQDAPLSSKSFFAAISFLPNQAIREFCIYVSKNPIKLSFSIFHPPCC
jgi:hypothetical protein